jgi:tRNA uridine 5-carboxymethylaminomethyl modification enzyme
VGAGHAGCEAALASARLGVKTLLLTINPDTIATMSCNPAIGGPAAKSHLVRELDALGGEMGKVIDQTFVNIRRINESRGPAVLALRAQADKKRYQSEMTVRLERQPNLAVKQGLVIDILAEKGQVTGVQLKSGRIYHAQAVILAIGTFLDGQIVMGNIKYSGGRQGEPAAPELSQSLKNLGLKLRRFQTATPPRIHYHSIDFTKITPQPLQEPEWGFSWDGLLQKRAQKPCWVTTTTPETIRVILDNIHLSPIRSGAIHSKGPHFCPSIDRKVINFPEKTDHLIFLEPEGDFTEEVYLLGMTTAMPEIVQESILMTIPGLERVEVIRPGYAVEYDCLDSFQFTASLESKQIQNLFTAGQINGTSGYEEASVQGLIAGVNAARKVKGEPPYIPDRTTSYIGVLIDDLVTQGTEEPYRMMTSLAEFRLFLRLDNSLIRLGEQGCALGLIPEDSWGRRCFLLEQIQELESLIQQIKIKPDSNIWVQLQLPKPSRGFRFKELILRPEINDIQALAVLPELRHYPQPVREYVWNQVKLSGYLARQENQINEMRELDAFHFSNDFSWASIPKLSETARRTLERVTPYTLGQALRIPNLPDADRMLLVLFCKKAG